MQPDPTRAAIADLLIRQQLATIATLSAEGPYCNLVAFTPSDDLETLVFSTPRISTKYKNLATNPNVALLVDNRTHAGADFQTGMAVTAIGKVADITPYDAEVLKRLHAQRHAGLSEFIYSPDCALVQIRVCRYILVSSLREVSILTIAS